MALYKFERHLKCSSDSAYDTVLPAGATASRSGIYRCDGCGFELTALAEQQLPGPDHHAHVASQKQVRWKLIVADSGPPVPGVAPASFQAGQGGTPASRPRRF